MKLYRARIPDIASSVIGTLIQEEHIEVSAEQRPEAELDLVAIMEEYLRREMDLRETVRENMARQNIPYDRYGQIRGRIASERNHPTGDDVERYLARQFVENFMISRFVDEVFSEDRIIYKRILEVLRDFHVDERAIRDEAREKVKNIAEGTVEYEIALSRAIKEVKKRHGLIS